MSDTPLRLLIIGAHPDDADYSAGGLAALYRQGGHVVKMISMTNGCAGHHQAAGPELVRRRRLEAAAAGQVIGATYDVLDHPDGELLPNLENRHSVIRLIRSFKPDLVLTHRPNDYHPDHRYTSQLVQDAAYMVTVPAVVPDTPHLLRDPVICYLPDDFQKPYPLVPSVVVDVGPVVDRDHRRCCTAISRSFTSGWRITMVTPISCRVEEAGPQGMAWPAHPRTAPSSCREISAGADRGLWAGTRCESPVCRSVRGVRIRIAAGRRRSRGACFPS